MAHNGCLHALGATGCARVFLTDAATVLTMSRLTLIHDLYAYHDWANEKLLTLSEGLSDAELDAQQPMGMGSLRATLYHMAFAERLWLDRWQSKPWAPLNHEPGGISLTKLADQFRVVAVERNALLDTESTSDYSRVVDYMNSAREPFRHRLRELLVHVVNHAIHHRSQALNFLRPWGRKATGGLDYLFYRLARPTVASDAESIALLKKHGLEMLEQIHPAPSYNAEVIRRYCAYGNWSMATLLELARPLSDAQLDQPFEMGVGSLRKTLQHICDAEQWWYQNWTGNPGSFPKADATVPFGEFIGTWTDTATRRDQWLAEKSVADFAEIVSATPGGAKVNFRLGESVLQLCGHGTHHRAQAINMMRRLGQKTPPSDYVVWLRGPGALQVK